MKLKAWYNVVFPRQDLIDGQAMDAAEFAVHLDEVHVQRGAEVYRSPRHFFERTYLTKHLLDFAAEVVRRLSGSKVATSACFTMSTQFGGGKTHALTLIYHLANNGPAAEHFDGVVRVMERAGVPILPKAKIAVFVGQRFDPRGGDDGSPLRRTPWGEIAWQLGAESGYRVVESFDQSGIAPGGDTLAKLFAHINQPILILMDEVVNYVSRYRATGLGGQMYNFLQNLTEEARAHDKVVVAISLPKSIGEMSAEDEADFRRITHLLDRLSKAVIMSAETDAAEIIRRRLFEWEEFTPDGRIQLGREAVATCNAYAEWLQQHRSQLPTWFPTDNAANEFKNTYPFHPTLLSVFERKWQSLPSFQRTRGVLRMLALWVTRAYNEGMTKERGRGEPLISLGSAPLDDPIFRQDLFGQLGDRGLETPVTTDIFGSRNAHAFRLDQEATDAIRRLQLHRKVATAIFFESNGGMSQHRLPATLQEIRLAVGQPEMDIGNVEIVLDALAPPDGACYYLDKVERGYGFSMRPNLNRVLAQLKDSSEVQSKLDERVRQAIQAEFAPVSGFSRSFFPERSSDIPNQAALTVVVLAPEQSLQERAATLTFINTYTQEYGASARIYKSALIWAVTDSHTPLREAGRIVLAWEEINERQDALQLSNTQKEQIPGNLRTARDKLREAVWQSYNKLFLLGKDGQLRPVELGRNHSEPKGMLALIDRVLQQYDEITDRVNPNFLVRNWPPAFKEWSTKSVKDAFFASPQFPRIKTETVIQESIAHGVRNGFLAYVSKLDDGTYVNFVYKDSSCTATNIAISDSISIITGENAEAYLVTQQVQPQAKIIADRTGALPTISDSKEIYVTIPVYEPLAEEPLVQSPSPIHPLPQPPVSPKITWHGSIPAQKWTNFYMKILTKFAANHTVAVDLKLTISGGDGISAAKIDEIRTALRDLGLDETIAME